MCGIAGMLGADRTVLVDPNVVRRMCNVIEHRGPDDEGVYVQGHVGLGMRRLSIIDLSTGHQPIHNEDESVWIVFNGEIYNFLELRPDLEARGHRFYTNTDTEVIVHLYEEYGSDCVSKLRGMFAFALYDYRRQVLLLARDRLGKKPLHYATSGQRFLFGSEIKSILVAAPELKEVSKEGLLNYFHFCYIPDPLTAYTDIHRLPPGHLLEYKDGETVIRKYWDVPAYSDYQPQSEDECLEQLEETLAKAVRIRLISDVPLGALLSGGVDSSTVVALMARASSKVKTFSIGFRNQDFNEASYARIVAKTFGTEHHELIFDPDISGTLEQLTYGMDEPFADSSMLPTYYVSRLARQHVTVALAGDGGDELFAGYDRFSIHLRRQKYQLPQWLGKLYRTQLYPRLPASVRGRKFAYNISLPFRDRYLDGLAFLPAGARERGMFTDEFLEAVAPYGSPFRRFEAFFDEGPAKDPLSRMLYLDTKTYLPGDILTKVDRMSMATSLEVRAPILDHLFVEQAARLSPDWKLRNGEQKYILKKLALRLGVPREVLYRKKQGFALPLVHWMRKELRGDLLGILEEPRTLQRGYVRPEAVREILREHYSGARDRSWEIWILLILELWHRHFLENPATLTGSSSPYGPLMQSQAFAAAPQR